MSDLTMKQITGEFNRMLDKLERERKNGRESGPESPQYIDILNRVTSGDWSVELARESGRQAGITELVRLIMDLGSPPMMRVQARLTLNTRDGPVIRHGSADGRDAGEESVRSIEQHALANAISTLRRSPARTP